MKSIKGFSDWREIDISSAFSTYISLLLFEIVTDTLVGKLSTIKKRCQQTRKLDLLFCWIGSPEDIFTWQY